jgi:hypothetical protein
MITDTLALLAGVIDALLWIHFANPKAELELKTPICKQDREEV